MTVKRMFETMSVDTLYSVYFRAIESDNVRQCSISIYNLTDEYLNAEAKGYTVDKDYCNGLGCITVYF